MLTDSEARTAVVEAADRLFYARGIQAVGMDAVRTEAGVPLKRIYALFPSKDDLIEAVLHHRSVMWETCIAAVTPPAANPRERLLAVFDFLDALFRADDFRGCVFINAFGELGSNSEKVATAVRNHKAAFRDHVISLAREAGLPDSLGIQIAILAEGAQASAAILADPKVGREARAAAEALLTATARV